MLQIKLKLLFFFNTTILPTFTFLRMFLKGKLRTERDIGDLVFADIVEALPKKLGFQRVSVNAFLYFIWNRFLKRKDKKK